MFDLTIDDIRREWKTAPNLISLARLFIFSPLAFLLILQPGIAGWFGVAVTLIGFLSDLVDGKLAKRNNGALMTKTGKVLDPVSDKVFTATVMVTLLIRSDPPLQGYIAWAFGIMVVLDLVVLIIRSHQTVSSALQAGRVTMAIRGVTAVVLSLPIAIALAPKVSLLAVAVAATVFSTAVYLLTSRRT